MELTTFLFEAPLIFSWATFNGSQLASPLRLQSVTVTGRCTSDWITRGSCSDYSYTAEIY